MRDDVQHRLIDEGQAGELNVETPAGVDPSTVGSGFGSGEASGQGVFKATVVDRVESTDEFSSLLTAGWSMSRRP